MTDFKRIALVASLDMPKVTATLNRLAQLLPEHGHEVVIESGTARLVSAGGLPTCDRDQLGGRVDLVIVVGGDGSMLAAARDLVDTGVPLLGVNRGRLGFLTDIMPSQVETRLMDVLGGKYRTSDRHLLHMTVLRKGEMVGEGLALNDVVIHPGMSVRMMEFELYVDDQFVYSQRSDGLIVSTPTGSTAYALSGGGPIVHPKLNATVLVPMNPHTLSNRPIVVDGDSRIRIYVGHRRELQPHITCDGQTHVVSEPGDAIEIERLPRAVRLIHPCDHNFYETCRDKLGWGSHLGNSRPSDFFHR